MPELTRIVTSKGRVTLPVSIRRQLGIAPGDWVVFVVEGEEVRLERVESVARRTAGLLASDLAALSLTAGREAAEQAIVDEIEPRASGPELRADTH